MSTVAIEVSRTVLLTETQHKKLEEDLVDAGAERQLSGREDDQSYAYYDNDGMALTMRGWWLSHVAATGSWSLRVPIYSPIKGDDGVPIGVKLEKHEELTVPEEILDRLGLTQHVELFRAGKASSLERLLRQTGVVVCAPVSSKQSCFALSGGSASDFLAVLAPPLGDGDESQSSRAAAKADNINLSVTFDALSLDVHYAENQAVSDLLFSLGNAARTALKPAVTKFTLRAQTKEGLCLEEAVAELRRNLAACICGHGFNVIPAPEMNPGFWAHLATLRPAHLRALYKGNALAGFQALDKPQDADGLTRITAPGTGGYLSGDAVPSAQEEKVE
jgi:hypothetical protein